MNSRQPCLALVKNLDFVKKLEVCSNMMCFVSCPQLSLFQSYNFFKSGPNCDSTLLLVNLLSCVNLYIGLCPLYTAFLRPTTFLFLFPLALCSCYKIQSYICNSLLSSDILFILLKHYCNNDLFYVWIKYIFAEKLSTKFISLIEIFKNFYRCMNLFSFKPPNLFFASPGHPVNVPFMLIFVHTVLDRHTIITYSLGSWVFEKYRIVCKAIVILLCCTWRL
jgi:hypothetical protein